MSDDESTSFFDSPRPSPTSPRRPISPRPGSSSPSKRNSNLSSFAVQLRSTESVMTTDSTQSLGIILPDNISTHSRPDTEQCSNIPQSQANSSFECVRYTNRFYMKVYERNYGNRTPEKEQMKNIESVYDYFNYTTQDDQLECLFSLMAFLFVSGLQFFSILMVRRDLKAIDEDQPPFFALFLCFLLFPAYNIYSLCFTSQKVLYFLIDKIFWDYYSGYEVELIESNKIEKIKSTIVTAADLSLLILVQITSVDLIRRQGTFTDSLVNLFALTFILGLDEILAQIIHVKVRVINYVDPGTTTPPDWDRLMSQAQRRIAKRVTYVLLYFLLFGISLAYCYI
jgi:hypothetical protein